MIKVSDALWDYVEIALLIGILAEYDALPGFSQKNVTFKKAIIENLDSYHEMLVYELAHD